MRKKKSTYIKPKRSTGLFDFSDDVELHDPPVIADSSNEDHVRRQQTGQQDIFGNNNDEGTRLRGALKTQITFNKGGKWQDLQAPPGGNSRQLNLHLYGDSDMFPPIYSVPSAVGIALGVGNTGSYLKSTADETNTYFTRDGGLTWDQVMKGPHIYEIGDHGALIVMAPTHKATTDLIYSWNEGGTWDSVKIFDEPLEVKNIIIEPDSVSQEFLLYGRPQNAAERTGVIIHLDFKGLHERICQGAQEPDQKHSDFETWSPYDGRHGQKCFMGRRNAYVRRKRDTECYNSEILERNIFQTNCQCSENDYECDTGYVRTESN